LLIIFDKINPVPNANIIFSVFVLFFKKNTNDFTNSSSIFLLFLITLASFVIFWPDNKVHLIACDVGTRGRHSYNQGFYPDIG